MFIFRVFIITDDKFNFYFKYWWLNKGCKPFQCGIEISAGEKNSVQYNDIHMDFISNIYVENGYVQNSYKIIYDM